jgi:hypothetical protein
MKKYFKMAVFRVVAPCSLVEVYRCFIALMEAASISETSVKFTGLHGATTQKKSFSFSQP